MHPTRRRFLALGSAATLGLAGCSGTPSGGTSTDDGGPTPEDERTTGAVGGDRDYDFTAATWDSYWYSLYNMSTNIAMSGNGVRFPHNEQQRQAVNQRLPAIIENADSDGPPIRDPYLNMAPFTEGDPSFTEEPNFDGGDGRPVGPTLRWDPDASSQTVSPSSLAWTHLKGVTWAKNFEQHFDLLPTEIRPKFRAQILSTVAQVGIRAALIAGGPNGNGALTKGDSMQLVSEFRPGGAAYGEDSRFDPPKTPAIPTERAGPTTTQRCSGSSPI